MVVDVISLREEKYILIAEAKEEPLGAAMGRCLLVLKDMSDSNHGSVVYGFVITGDSWWMLSYGGAIVPDDRRVARGI